MAQFFVVVHADSKPLEILEGPDAMLARVAELIGTMDANSKKLAGRFIDGDVTMMTNQLGAHPYVNLRGVKDGASKEVGIYIAEKK